jgi:hypothetical protein
LFLAHGGKMMFKFLVFSAVLRFRKSRSGRRGLFPVL